MCIVSEPEDMQLPVSIGSSNTTLHNLHDDDVVGDAPLGRGRSRTRRGSVHGTSSLLLYASGRCKRSITTKHCIAHTQSNSSLFLSYLDVVPRFCSGRCNKQICKRPSSPTL